MACSFSSCLISSSSRREISPTSRREGKRVRPDGWRLSRRRGEPPSHLPFLKLLRPSDARGALQWDDEDAWGCAVAAEQ
ncbi:hypothetical protein BDA96_06G125100 [Sorghum bicolor]|uniref:Uncharacterized protein n=2 Tax=Sorghum bicolor TaxID=4558 RepID=A0A921QR11_SORBI|nr:hypothetical protein BDA96_06G125100 [Sorghum bicolor]OQU81752.1 hypothetical protein SORBI_3006G112850 [Sorghum bicolor]